MKWYQHKFEVPQHEFEVPQHEFEVPQHEFEVPQHEFEVPQTLEKALCRIAGKPYPRLWQWIEFDKLLNELFIVQPNYSSTKRSLVFFYTIQLLLI
ncbi:hypothetical protein B4U84_07125 [Westiellopsis prolifica IICB1]|nr:hypothetical protein B4U84_07125 [Westiellopsis prolifica IICB1]